VGARAEETTVDQQYAAPENIKNFDTNRLGLV
jgi:hypothetical protein